MESTPPPTSVVVPDAVQPPPPTAVVESPPTTSVVVPDAVQPPPPTAVVESPPPTSVVVPDAVQPPPPSAVVESPPPTSVVVPDAVQPPPPTAVVESPPPTSVVVPDAVQPPPPSAVVESPPPTSVVVPDAVQPPPPPTAVVESDAVQSPLPAVVAIQSPPPTAVVECLPPPAVLPTGSTDTVTVSDSPVKPDQNVWLEKLDLLIMDKDILQSDKWLNDNIVHAAQLLLSQQSKGKITGWQHTQCAKTRFKALPRRSTFIQILHVSNCHWILVSNVNPKDGSGFFNSVGIYDSNRMMYVEKALKNEICSFVKPTCDVYTFDVMNIQTQTNTSDCGLFSIACATELVEGHDPVVCHWDQAKMRPHLMKCLVEGKMVRFPCSKQRRIGLGQRMRKSEKEQLYCVCRLPNDKVRAMIECTSCRNWFHNGCVGLESTDVSELRWRCMKCSQALTFF